MRQYTEVQPKLWKNLYQFYKDNDISSLSSEDQSKKLSEFLQQQGFSAQWAAVSAQIYINIMQKKDTMPEFPQELGSKTVSLSALDQAFLSSAFVNHESPEICRLLVAFAAYARAYPHSSNWIQYDKKTIMYLSGLDKLRVQEQQSLTNYLHEHYNLNMQVVGSTQPIPCFRFEWQASQPRISSIVDEDGVVVFNQQTGEPTNPLVVFGPLTPATIVSYVDQMQNSLQKEVSNN